MSDADVMGMSGVYKLYFNGSENFYIGSASVSFKVRMRHHVHQLSKGTHHNQPLSRGVEKYGICNLVMEPLAICPPSDCVLLEVALIQFLRPSYNASKVSNTRLGVKASKETREKLSKKRMGVRLTEEHKAKISKSLLLGDNKISKEHREKLRQIMSGRIVSEVTRKKLSDLNTGKRHSLETRLKMSKSHSVERNKTKHRFLHDDGREVFETVYVMKSVYGCDTHIHSVINGDRPKCKGWRLNNK